MKKNSQLQSPITIDYHYYNLWN